MSLASCGGTTTNAWNIQRRRDFRFEPAGALVGANRGCWKVRVVVFDPYPRVRVVLGLLFVVAVGRLRPEHNRIGHVVEDIHFARAQRAAMAVEFALAAPIFIVVLLAVLQVAIFLFAQQVLQNAALEAGRLFMTGSAQSLTQAQFKSKVCLLVQTLFNCDNLIVIVQSYGDFASASTSSPTLYTNGVLNTNWSYDPGTPDEVMVVQLVYQWSVVGGPLGFVLSNLPNSAAEMMGVSAFRVEPYKATSCASNTWAA